MQKRTENQITALYCRLSQDDGVDMESNSIQNQRKILQEYVDNNRIRNTMFFADDGYSGTDFNRPDFQRMETMVERGEIGTIIVKDLSRFARNYIEAGNYIEVKYPSMGVRFIAIQENIDTAEGTGIEMMPFYNIFNEWHAAQTSKKVREVFRVKAAEGKRVFCRPPYGYKRADDSEQWIIDEGAAKIVRRIFDMCIQGLSTGEIAKQLQSERVLTPTCYWISEGRNTNCTPQENPYRWCNTTISHILKNLQYTGCAINFQTTTISYKVHDRMACFRASRKRYGLFSFFSVRKQPTFSDSDNCIRINVSNHTEVACYTQYYDLAYKSTIVNDKCFFAMCERMSHYYRLQETQLNYTNIYSNCKE